MKRASSCHRRDAAVPRSAAEARDASIQCQWLTPRHEPDGYCACLALGQDARRRRKQETCQFERHGAIGVMSKLPRRRVSAVDVVSHDRRRVIVAASASEW